MSLGSGLEIGPDNKGLLGECFSSATNAVAETLGLNQAPAQDQSIEVAANGDTKVENGIIFTKYDDKWFYPGMGPTSLSDIKKGYPIPTK